MKTLYLIRGTPGSGKSTFANELVQSGLVQAYLEADQHFMNDGEYLFDVGGLHLAHSRCQNRADLYLDAGFSIAVSNTSTTEKEVKVYKDLADKYNAKFVSLVVENRSNTTSIHNVPDDKIKQMKERFSVKL